MSLSSAPQPRPFSKTGSWPLWAGGGGVRGRGEPGLVVVDRVQAEALLDVKRWAELRREHFVRGVSIKELMRRTGLARNTIRAALRSGAPPTFR
jgi:hypothetical protein